MSLCLNFFSFLLWATVGQLYWQDMSCNYCLSPDERVQLPPGRTQCEDRTAAGDARGPQCHSQPPYGPSIWGDALWICLGNWVGFMLLLSPRILKNWPKLLDRLMFCIYPLNFSLEFFIMIFFVTNQLNIAKFLPPQIRKTIISC